MDISKLTGLHILLTYSCNYECDHCFVWGSPWQTGAFTLNQLEDVFQQAQKIGSIRKIYFEGGEAFLYYPILVEAVGRARRLGFSVGIVTNGYWATGAEDAWIWLQPLAAAGLDNLEVSCDLFHGEGENGTLHSPDEAPEVLVAKAAARDLFIDTGTISIEPPTGYRDPAASEPGRPVTGGGVMYRGRAAEKLVDGLPRQPLNSFTECPYENLVDPGRIHLDPFGNLHICQGIVIGNLFERPLEQIINDYEPSNHPIVGPLLEGGPAGLARQFDLEGQLSEPPLHKSGFVDACHLCYTARQELRTRYPAELGPDQMYGVN
jgi:MoaA/NifB/PqqE/SkfB family radical SAM enzyme